MIRNLLLAFAFEASVLVGVGIVRWEFKRQARREAKMLAAQRPAVDEVDERYRSAIEAFWRP